MPRSAFPWNRDPDLDVHVEIASALRRWGLGTAALAHLWEMPPARVTA
ncbi:hypothetical protein ACIQ7Q_04800 [Streptomyces sp. NPDC096176]